MLCATCLTRFTPWLAAMLFMHSCTSLTSPGEYQQLLFARLETGLGFGRSCFQVKAVPHLLMSTYSSWLCRYSWIVSSLVGAVYMFGFILMCPQVCACLTSSCAGIEVCCEVCLASTCEGVHVCSCLGSSSCALRCGHKRILLTV